MSNRDCPCCQIETVTKRHLAQSKPAPERLQEISTRIAREEGLLMIAPKLRCIELECKTTFGGRWFAAINTIVVILHPGAKTTEGVTVHEHGHWLCWARAGDEPGEHEELFMDVMTYLYPKHGVSLATAKLIEQQYPKAWNSGKTWEDIVK